MYNNIFQEIDSLHSEWLKMDKVSRFAMLTRERIRLNQLTNQLAQYIKSRGGFSNDDEWAYARKLLEMTLDVDMEGAKVVNDIANDALRELVKSLMKY